MKLNELPKITSPSGPTFIQELTKFMRETAQKVNQMASGANAGLDGQSSSVPTSGVWAAGDFVKKTAPVEAGSASSKYVVVGWIRVTDGDSNVLNTDWLECRYLTGN